MAFKLIISSTFDFKGTVITYVEYNVSKILIPGERIVYPDGSI